MPTNDKKRDDINVILSYKERERCLRMARLEAHAQMLPTIVPRQRASLRHQFRFLSLVGVLLWVSSIKKGRAKPELGFLQLCLIITRLFHFACKCRPHIKGYFLTRPGTSNAILSTSLRDIPPSYCTSVSLVSPLELQGGCVCMYVCVSWVVCLYVCLGAQSPPHRKTHSLPSQGQFLRYANMFRLQPRDRCVVTYALQSNPKNNKTNTICQQIFCVGKT